MRKGMTMMLLMMILGCSLVAEDGKVEAPNWPAAEDTDNAG